MIRGVQDSLNEMYGEFFKTYPLDWRVCGVCTSWRDPTAYLVLWSNKEKYFALLILTRSNLQPTTLLLKLPTNALKQNSSKQKKHLSASGDHLRTPSTVTFFIFTIRSLSPGSLKTTRLFCKMQISLQMFSQLQAIQSNLRWGKITKGGQTFPATLYAYNKMYILAKGFLVLIFGYFSGVFPIAACMVMYAVVSIAGQR